MIRQLLRGVFRCLLRVSVVGDVAPVLSGRTLIVANYDSLIDGILLGLFMPGRVTVAVTPAEYRDRLIRLLLRAVDHVVVEPSHPLALKALMRRLERGQAVAVFPQGQPTRTGGLSKVYDAAALVAARSGAQIVPVHIAGTIYTRFRAVKGAFPLLRFPRVTLTVLPPQRLPSLPQLPAKRRRRRLADHLLRLMQEMVVAARPPATLFGALLDAAYVNGAATRILEDTQGEYSYRDIIRMSLALGRLSSKLAADGEIVGVMMPNVVAAVGLLLGIGAMRRVPAMLNYTSGPDALRSACVATGIKTVITSRRFVSLARLDAAVAALSTVRIVYVEDLRGRFGLLDKLWLAGWALWRPRSAVPAVDPESTAVVLFTSGSEARPKGVALSHGALLANMAQMKAVIDFGPNDKFLSSLPIYHAYALTACTLMPLMFGTRVFLYTTPLHYRAIPQLAYARGCTYLFGTSTFLGHYARQAHDYDFSSVRVVVSGAEKLNQEVAELWLRRFGLRIMEGYGATECAPVLTLNAPLAYRAGTVGRLLPAVEHRVLPVTGISRGGRLHVRGPNLMQGYYLYSAPGALQPPHSVAGAGWYDTGDVVEIDDDGFVTIHGRVKRFIKVAGEMVSLEVVESIAHHASPHHVHAATVELIQASGESTVLFTTDSRLTRQLLQKAARELGAQELAVARRVVHVRELPLLGTGKTNYLELREMAEVRSGQHQ